MGAAVRDAPPAPTCHLHRTCAGHQEERQEEDERRDPEGSAIGRRTIQRLAKQDGKQRGQKTSYRAARKGHDCDHSRLRGERIGPLRFAGSAHQIRRTIDSEKGHADPKEQPTPIDPRRPHRWRQRFHQQQERQSDCDQTIAHQQRPTQSEPPADGAGRQRKKGPSQLARGDKQTNEVNTKAQAQQIDIEENGLDAKISKGETSPSGKKSSDINIKTAGD